MGKYDWLYYMIFCFSKSNVPYRKMEILAMKTYSLQKSETQNKKNLGEVRILDDKFGIRIITRENAFVQEMFTFLCKPKLSIPEQLPFSKSSLCSGDKKHFFLLYVSDC